MLAVWQFSKGDIALNDIIKIISMPISKSAVRESLNTLAEKSMVGFKWKPGGVLDFNHIVPLSLFQGSILRRLVVNYFGGSGKKLALNLINERYLSCDDVAEMVGVLLAASDAQNLDRYGYLKKKVIPDIFLS